MRWVAVSSIVAGIAGYVVIALATASLGERFEIFNVYWGLFFMLQGIVQGVMHETARGVRAVGRPQDVLSPTDELEGPDGALRDELEAGEAPAASEESERAARATSAASHGAGIRPLWPALGIGALGAILVLATAPLWSRALVPDEWALPSVLLLAAAVGLAALQAVVCGLLSGVGRWRAYAVLMMLDALLRLAVAAWALTMGDRVAGFLLATVVGVLATPLVLAISPAARRALLARTDVDAPRFLARSAQAMIAASAAAILVVGLPVLIKTARPELEAAAMSSLLLAVTLTRAPVLMPITSFQNAIVVYFVDRRDAGRGVVLRPAAAVLAIALLGAIAAVFIGPWIIGLMSDRLVVDGIVLGLLTFAAGFTGVLFITGSAVLARDRHAIYVAGWWTASAAAILALVLIPDIVAATVAALSLGPLLGSLVHVALGLRPRSAAPDATRPDARHAAAIGTGSGTAETAPTTQTGETA